MPAHELRNQSGLLPEHVRPFIRPEFYPHSTGDIIMLQTHISWVFLAGDFAYKIKKPVNLGFLDFTTLESRHNACLKELQLNRRLAPAIYLDVLQVNQQHADYRLNGGGPAVDYCLKMVRFDQEDLLDYRIESQTFDPAWMDDLAGQIASFHATAEISTTDARSRLEDHIHANLEAARSHSEATDSQAWLAGLERLISEWLDKNSQSLARRQQNGMVRDCHGDLHLKNITLFRGRPTPFDCIEFNDAFRIIDTMNDAAFLIMDCDARKHPELGLRFLSRYLEQTGDYDGLSLLPLYLSYRAGVRGKVACLLADDAGISGDERQRQLAIARDYFRLAERYLHDGKPKLFAIGGLSGSGKSHLSLLGMKEEHAIVIRTDATRRRIAPEHPELPLYGDEMHRLTYKAMFEAARTALQADCSVILDATFLHAGARRTVAELADELDIPFTFYWLDISPDELRRRITARSHAGSDISDADLHVLELQLKGYRTPDEPFIRRLDCSDRWPGPQPD